MAQIQFQELKKNDIAQINIEKAISIREKLSKLNIQHLIECIDSKITLTTIFLANKQFLKAKLLIDEIKTQLEKYLNDYSNEIPQDSSLIKWTIMRFRLLYNNIH